MQFVANPSHKLMHLHSLLKLDKTKIKLFFCPTAKIRIIAVESIFKEEEEVYYDTQEVFSPNPWRMLLSRSGYLFPAKINRVL